MVSRAVLAAALLLGCGWATTMARTSAPPAEAAEHLAAPLPGAARFGPDAAQSAAQAIKLASNDVDVERGMAPPRGASAADAAPVGPLVESPRGWTLLGAGAWLIVSVSRRRKRSALF